MNEMQCPSLAILNLLAVRFRNYFCKELFFFFYQIFHQYSICKQMFSAANSKIELCFGTDQAKIEKNLDSLSDYARTSRPIRNAIQYKANKSNQRREEAPIKMMSDMLLRAHGHLAAARARAIASLGMHNWSIRYQGSSHTTGYAMAAWLTQKLKLRARDVRRKNQRVAEEI